mgnify:CR=1 FL=1
MSDMNHHTIDIAEITDVEKSDKEADFEITDNFERFKKWQGGGSSLFAAPP